MSFLSGISDLFKMTPPQTGMQKDSSSAAAAEKILNYMFGFVHDKKLVSGIYGQYGEIRKLPAKDRETACIPLFFLLEDFITKNNPPIVEERLSKEELREQVKKTIPPEEMGIGFRLIFLPKLEQYCLLYDQALRILTTAEIRQMGALHAKEGIVTATEKTILEGMVLPTGELDIPRLTQKLQSVSTDDFTGAFRSLYGTLYKNLRAAFDPQIAESAAKEAYEWVKARYRDQDIILRFFEGIPENVLEAERIMFLSREMLEKQVQERTREVEEKENRLEVIISSIGEGLIVVDRNLVVTLLNPATSRILSMIPSELIGKNIVNALQMFKDDRQVSQDAHPIFQAISRRKTVIAELAENYTYQTAGHTKFPVSMIITPLFVRGQTTGAVLVFRDVTETKKLEEARSNFISVASHQLRTPLTSMRWFVEMLLAGDAGAINDDQKHFVMRVYEGTDRMINLVNLLLQIARVEAGRVKVDPTLLDLKKLAEEVYVSLKTVIDQKFQKVTIAANPEPFPAIPADKDIVWQVFQNLISNANRYSPDNSVIAVSIEKDKDMAEIAVKDSGIGIPENQQSRIFEKFFRAENALKMVPEGSGLGLTLIKSLVEGWGGKIWFESGQGKGTVFYFTIPLAGMASKEGEVKLTV
ncbi:MAG: two-component system, OmpR family, phosphate regulon sensor histidine kinase PhoR [Parcubacteria group bacterium Gr01-1014_33]|nr:MAG: two-component system, OmpR family, phosphate regulon sensor histidine kinase PhoR [Parcubacteria group bacterium Gr01-1014_33]